MYSIVCPIFFSLILFSVSNLLGLWSFLLYTAPEISLDRFNCKTQEKDKQTNKKKQQKKKQKQKTKNKKRTKKNLAIPAFLRLLFS